MKNFPFKYPENQATIVCKHVIENEKDISLVTHDSDDGMWQFLCSETHESINDALLVALSTPYKLDKSIASIADMKEGYQAVRKNRNSEWIISKNDTYK